MISQKLLKTIVITPVSMRLTSVTKCSDESDDIGRNGKEYYSFFLGPEYCSGEFREFDIHDVLKSKTTFVNHVETFYHNMVECFSSYGEGYGPTSKEDITIIPLKDYEEKDWRNIKEYRSASVKINWAKKLFIVGIVKSRDNLASQAIELTYGVSGGFHLDCTILLVPVSALDTLFI